MGIFYAGESPNTGIYGVKYSLNEVISNPKVSTKSLTYYVRTDGNDLNEGSADDSVHAFKTIQRAFDLIPKTILYGHTITINVAAGTYNEDAMLTDINGAGSLYIYGDTMLSTSRTVNSMWVINCNINIFVIRGFNTTSTTRAGFFVGISKSFAGTLLKCVTISAGQPGFRTVHSMLTVSSSEFSNRSYGIRNQFGNIVSDTNIGTGNTIGLSSEWAGTIGKNGTQPAGTTAESTSGGGIIR